MLLVTVFEGGPWELKRSAWSERQLAALQVSMWSMPLQNGIGYPRFLAGAVPE